MELEQGQSVKPPYDPHFDCFFSLPPPHSSPRPPPAKLWDKKTHQLLRSLEASPLPLTCMASDHAGRVVAANAMGQVREEGALLHHGAFLMEL